MNLKELQKLTDVIVDLQDFVEGNCDGDESGIYERMTEQCGVAKKIIYDAKFKIYLKNAKAKNKRKTK